MSGGSMGCSLTLLGVNTGSASFARDDVAAGEFVLHVGDARRFDGRHAGAWRDGPTAAVEGFCDRISDDALSLAEFCPCFVEARFTFLIRHDVHAAVNFAVGIEAKPDEFQFERRNWPLLAVAR